MKALAMTIVLGAAAAGAQTLTSDDFFNDKVLHDIRLDVHPLDWKNLRENYRENFYYYAEFEWRGIKLYNVGIRSRGTGSRSPIKPGIHIDFNRYEENQEFLGLKAVELKNMAQDASMLKDRLSMALFRRMGLVASRYAHARLYINDQYYGVYAVVESIDKRFLKRCFNEDDGYLYENKWTGTAYFFTFPVPAGVFAPSTHEKDPNPKPLENMVGTMNQASDADFVNAMSEYLDLKLFLRHLAVETLLADSDGIMGDSGARNFDLYNFERKNLFQFIVWDKDNTFSEPNRPVVRDSENVVLIRRALAVPELRAAYFEGLLRCAAWAGAQDGWLDQEITREFEQIREAARADNFKQCPSDFNVFHNCTMEEVENEVARMREFVRQRAEFVRRQVAEAGYQFREAAPKLNQGGAVSAAGGAPNVTPGSLASLYAPFLGDTSAAASGIPLPTALSGLTVLINGFPAPLIFVAPQQANLQVPWEVASGTVSITAELNGLPGNTITAEVAPLSPGIFVVTHADAAPITAEKPAVAGEVLIAWATGLGAVNGSVATGEASPAAITRDTAKVTIGGKEAVVDYAGLTPGAVGLYQVNVQVPPDVPAGTATPLVLSIGGKSAAGVPIITR